MTNKPELLSMSPKEIKRLEVLEKLSSKRISQIEAAKLLEIDTRHIFDDCSEVMKKMERHH